LKQVPKYRFQAPEQALQPYVDGFWSLQYEGEAPMDVVLLPDGKIDLLFSSAKQQPYHVVLVGLSTLPEKLKLLPGLVMFGISFHPLGLEYILRKSMAGFVNKALLLPSGFWGMENLDLDDFKGCVQQAVLKITALVPKMPDNRKLLMQRVLNETGGNMTVQAMEKRCFISARQLNRYWEQQLGLPLKTYMQILRFRQSFNHIKNGKLYPEGNYADQSHFIKEVKRLSGHLPKELLQNQNDRFLQFTVMPSR